MTKNPFPLGIEIFEISRMLRREFEARARTHGFTHGQWRALAHLDLNQGISQAGLAEILDTQPISLARVIDRMVVSGLVERRPDPKDRRAVQLYLTAAARPMLAQLHAIAEDLRVMSASALSADEQEMLLSLLRRVRTGMAAPETPDTQTPETPRKIARVG